MATTAHRSTSETPDRALIAFGAIDPHDDDITSELASRVGDLYAAEEFRQRRERTERIIQRASAPIEE